MATPDIMKDPRYPDFVGRYVADPLRFAEEVTGFRPSLDQTRLFMSIVEPKAKVSVVSGTGCFAKGTMMMRDDGEPVAVENVRTGDRLMGADGNSIRHVLSTVKGRESMYRFTLVDGTVFTFNESHILTLAPGAKYKKAHPEIVNVTVKDWLRWPKTRKERYYFYRKSVRRFARKEKTLSVPPYVLGIWLGDGTSLKPQITTMDCEVDAAFTQWAESLGCTVSRSKNSLKSWTVQACRRNGTEQSNPCTKSLRKIGVWGNKHIPKEYKFAPIDDRAELLAGLIDTDGYVDGTGYGFTQKNEHIARDVAWLARSIGCHATVKPTVKQCSNTGVLNTYWAVHISRNAEKIPVRVTRRKVPTGRKQRAHLLFSVKNVECLGEGDYFGFVLDGDHRFLAHDFTVLHNTGKTASFGRIALWHLLCFPMVEYEGKTEIGSNTYIGAPVVQQVADGVWKEMQDVRVAISQGPYAWLNEYYEITAERVVVKGYEKQWFIAQIALARGKSVGIAGKHRFHQMIIVDEAAGVPDDHYNVINGTQTQDGNRTLLASQGVRTAGFFYDTHHTLKRENGGSWTAICFSSERSPFVTDEWLHDREVEAGGRNSVEYQIRVLGLFAQSSSNYLMTRDVLDRAFEDKKIIDDDEEFGYVVLCDVAAGEYRDDSVVIVAKVIGNSDMGADARRVEFVDIPIASNDKNVIDLAGDIIDVVKHYPNASLYIDAGGIGAAVCKMIENDPSSTAVVNRINWGAPCFRNEYRDRFYNLRACAMVRLRDAVKQGRVVMPKNITRKIKEKILDEGTRLPYHFAESGKLRYKMMSKEDMRKEGIKSPDMIDAMAFAFLEGTTYMASGEGGAGVRNQAVAVMREAENAFSDI